MLVLSRKVGESILINESIRVTVVKSAKNGTIRLGFDAPAEVIVLREELTRSRPNLSPSKNGNAESTASVPTAILSTQVQVDLPV